MDENKGERAELGDVKTGSMGGPRSLGCCREKAPVPNGTLSSLSAPGTAGRRDRGSPAPAGAEMSPDTFWP